MDPLSYMRFPPSHEPRWYAEPAAQWSGPRTWWLNLHSLLSPMRILHVTSATWKEMKVAQSWGEGVHGFWALRWEFQQKIPKRKTVVSPKTPLPPYLQPKFTQFFFFFKFMSTLNIKTVYLWLSFPSFSGPQCWTTGDTTKRSLNTPGTKESTQESFIQGGSPPPSEVQTLTCTLWYTIFGG